MCVFLILFFIFIFVLAFYVWLLFERFLFIRFVTDSYFLQRFLQFDVSSDFWKQFF